MLSHPTSGNATIADGTLQASGTLSSLSLSATSGILDIGGASPATLTVGSFSPTGLPSTLTIDFGIGSSGSDLWKLSTALFPFPGPTLQFEFQNLGGVVSGVDYTLLAFPFGSSLSASSLTFAPDMAVAGWAGSFKVSGTAATVKFTSVPVPEPTSPSLLLGAAASAFLLLRHPLRAASHQIQRASSPKKSARI